MRKTAAVCVAKLYDINPELVDDRGFLDQVQQGIKGLWRRRSAIDCLHVFDAWARAVHWLH